MIQKLFILLTLMPRSFYEASIHNLIEILNTTTKWSFCGVMAELWSWSKRVRTPVALLRSLSDYYPWESYEHPHPWLWVKKHKCCSTRMALPLNNPQKLICQKTKPSYDWEGRRLCWEPELHHWNFWVHFCYELSTSTTNFIVRV